jgi:hypothetical protein
VEQVLVGFILTGTITFISSYTTLWLRRLSSNPRNQPYFLKKLTPHSVTDPAEFWISILTELVLQLSDQQLIVGLLLLICAYIKYWPSSVIEGSNNLWTATDIVCFSSFTHAATLLTLRPYFRKHRQLATGRVIMMYIIYILWLVVAVQILSPNKPRGSTKEPQVIANFWRAATYIEALGVMWIYLIAYLPIFLSKEAAEVRDVISKGSKGDLEVVKAWIDHHKRRNSSGSVLRTVWKKYNPYAFARRYLTRFAVRFSELYVNTKSKWLRCMLWAAAELLFPWYIAGIILGVLWAFSLGALILSLYQSGLASSWDFGQLLPAVMVLLPFQSFISVIAGTLTHFT